MFEQSPKEVQVFITSFTEMKCKQASGFKALVLL